MLSRNREIIFARNWYSSAFCLVFVLENTDVQTMTQADNTTTAKPFRCGYAALIGAPNAGKSTFMNAVLGAKISIVTAKPQTTRRRLLGFHTTDAHQILFIDTPGLIKPRYRLQQAMVNSAMAAIREADVVLHLIDAARAIKRGDVFPHGLLDVFAEAGQPVLSVLNKVDLLPDKKQLLPLMDSIHNAYRFGSIIPISALEGDGIDSVIAALVALLPVGPPLFPEDQLSDQPERFFVSEIIREKIFEQFRDEVPYATEVYIAEFREGEGQAKDFISAEIVVERESQRRIILGTGGQAIKRIGAEARQDIEEFLGRDVFLDLHVRIRERWRDDAAWVRRMGYTD
jgi:GTPase